MNSRLGILLVSVAAVCVVPASAQSIVAGDAPRFDSSKPAPPPPKTYGGSQDSYVMIHANEFTPFDSGTTYNDLGNGGPFFSRYPTAGNGYFYAGVNAPGGALLTYVELDYCDSSTVGNHVHLYLYDCRFDGSNCAQIAPTATSSSDAFNTCSNVSVDLTGVTYQFDNFLHRVYLSSNTDAFDGTNSISGVIVGYRLQVSPPPLAASFVDVPTTSPIFKFVEALRASGITAGCDATHYCPNDPLTRGQMAVFLAAGLGLQFP